ncbi:MAG: HI0074 family nucleotidyltransferase substrate-binding subunit [Selenomonadaceae bacterium]|nr:HI0074 family nucleotidyltransferase substrate-binding subunit [Selenomonadaceae bacterium]
MYGLSIKQIKTLLGILSTQGNSILQVKIFGSRARGDYRKTSDIDLAVSFARPIQSLLSAAFENSDLPYTIDIVDYNAINNKNLLNNINRDGKIIFNSSSEGVLMTAEELNLKLEDYCRACEKLQSALTKDISADDLYLDGVIQRFEFCFELSWKLMKAYLSFEGIETNSPRSSIRESFKIGIITETEEWLDMLEKRNLSSHTYDEETAKEIYQHIAQKYILLLINFRDVLQIKLNITE